MTVEATNNRIGILSGGGPAPGINGVIYAATMEAYQNRRDVIGIYDGFKHLMKG
jgi:6-phosphofructokinase